LTGHAEGKEITSVLAVVPLTAPEHPRTDFDLPPPPDHLGERERQIWREVLDDFDLSTRAAHRVLETALEAHQRAREARETIERDGMTVTGRDGQLRPHPLLAVERDARQAWLAGIPGDCGLRTLIPLLHGPDL
jgi:P27 family predicted phage terminase small subunit